MNRLFSVIHLYMTNLRRPLDLKFQNSVIYLFINENLLYLRTTQKGGKNHLKRD